LLQAASGNKAGGKSLSAAKLLVASSENAAATAATAADAAVACCRLLLAARLVARPCQLAAQHWTRTGTKHLAVALHCMSPALLQAFTDSKAGGKALSAGKLLGARTEHCAVAAALHLPSFSAFFQAATGSKAGGKSLSASKLLGASLASLLLAALLLLMLMSPVYLLPCCRLQPAARQVASPCPLASCWGPAWPAYRPWLLGACMTNWEEVSTDTGEVWFNRCYTCYLCCMTMTMAVGTMDGQLGGGSNRYRCGLSFMLLRICYVCHLVNAMAAGGIYDLLGGGFHRYSCWQQTNASSCIYLPSADCRLHSSRM
jgi:hypothetical protein